LHDDVSVQPTSSTLNDSNRPSTPTDIPKKAQSYLIGLIGKDIQRSKSPLMHEQEGRDLGILVLYQLLDLNVLGRDVDALPRVLAGAELMGFAGLNVTHPCKQAVIPLLNELSEEARAIGAVNTVRLSDGHRKGYNTDASGFAESFRRGLPEVPLDRVVQIGAGGAGAATAYAMLKMGAKHLQIVDTTPERADGLGQESIAILRPFPPVRGRGHQRRCAERRAWCMPPQPACASIPAFRSRKAPYTRAYGLPRWCISLCKPSLLRLARLKGCRTLDGGGMAVFQAAAAFDIFTQHSADRERMLRNFRAIPVGLT
jgi:shikimate dehydrogenase